MLAAHERVVPVVTTAFAAGLALLPTLIAGGDAGRELVYPLSVVVLGGLVTATLMTLFVVPLLYLRFFTAYAFETDETAEASLERRSRSASTPVGVSMEPRQVAPEGST